MCNLYSMHRADEAIPHLVKPWKQQPTNQPPLPGIFPDMQAPVIANVEGIRPFDGHVVT